MTPLSFHSGVKYPMALAALIASVLCTSLLYTFQTSTYEPLLPHQAISAMSTFPEPWTSSVSHWQATNRGRTSLWGHNEHAKLPTEADVVIVGAGTMGSSLSYFLTREDAYGAGKKVVCVEAKDCGSGASGRNGGQ